jgi:hypothetical protein
MTTELDLIADELAAAQPQSKNLRRNGKIARLPREIRDMLNRMLDDGLPYHVIIEELGEHGRGLNHQNITNWVHGGYQDYLKHQEAVDRARAIVEAVVEFLHENGDTDLTQVRRACNSVASIQLFDAIRNHGDDTLKRLFQATPAKYLNIVHTLCHLSNSALKVEKHRLQQDLHAAGATASSSQIKVNQAPQENAAELQLTPGGAPSASSSQIKVNQAPAENPDELQLTPATTPSAPAVPSSQIKPDQAPPENSTELQPRPTNRAPL